MDDVVDIVEASRMLLALLGHNCTTVSSGADALAVLESFDPDIIVLDVRMPKMSGYEVAQELRRRGTRAFLVALTGFAAPTDRVRAIDAGFDLHVAKPANITSFRHILELASRHLLGSRQDLG